MAGGRFAIYAGWILTVLSVLFLLMDAGMKLAGANVAVEASGALGFDKDQVRLLGVVLLVCTVLYAVPQTAFLGAVLIAAYLGGVVAVNFQHHTALLSHTLFGVYVGLFVWGGLFLRAPLVQSIFPIVRQP